MKTYVQKGDVVDYVAGSAISSGDIVAIGNVVGVATADIANGETGAVLIEGVVDLPKATGVISVGDLIDYDVSAGNVSTGITPATGDVTGLGVAVAAAASGDATVRVKLTPGGGAVN